MISLINYRGHWINYRENLYFVGFHVYCARWGQFERRCFTFIALLFQAFCSNVDLVSGLLLQCYMEINAITTEQNTEALSQSSRYRLVVRRNRCKRLPVDAILSG